MFPRHLLLYSRLQTFRQYAPDYKPPFMIMGFTIIGSSLLSLLIRIKGHAGLICGQDSEEVKKSAGAGTIQVPAPDEEEGDEEEAETEKATEDKE